MKNPPRRSQPSRIAALGRAILRGGPASAILAAVVMLVLFVAFTLPVVVLLTGGDEPAPPPPGVAPQDVAFSQKLARVDEAIRSLLVEMRLPEAGTLHEIKSPRTADGHSFSHRYREVPLRRGDDVGRVVARFHERVADRQAGVTVLDDEFDAKVTQVIVLVDGTPTHTIILSRTRVEDDTGEKVVSRPDPNAVPERLRHGPPKVAIIIDDIGFRPDVEKTLLAVDADLTFSVLPFSPGGTAFAERAHKAGREIMLHMPMEPVSYPENKPGRGALFADDDPAELARNLEAAIADVPYAVGVNNHMGSRFTQDARRMGFALEKIAENDMFFVDSYTHAGSVGYPLALEMGVKTAVRNVFLDHDPAFSAIAERLGELVSLAERQGYAVGIGHPHVTTAEALATYLPGFEKRGVAIVPASALVH